MYVLHIHMRTHQVLNLILGSDCFRPCYEFYFRQKVASHEHSLTLHIVIIYFYGYKCANKHTQANEHGAEKLSPCITLTLSQCQKNSNTTIENSSKCEKGQKSYMQEDQQHQLMSGPLIFPDATYSINFREGAAGNLGRHTPKKMWEHTLLPYFFA